MFITCEVIDRLFRGFEESGRGHRLGTVSAGVSILKGGVFVPTTMRQAATLAFDARTRDIPRRPGPASDRRQLQQLQSCAAHKSLTHTLLRMTPNKPREYLIQGITRNGRPFRPSDWAERLAGALSTFRPKGAGIGAHIGYSPFCVPRVIDGVKCVMVNEGLRDIEPMAWDFVMNFARDNELRVLEAGPKAAVITAHPKPAAALGGQTPSINIGLATHLRA